jgi:para-aminobenzoate synthetase component II
MILVIDNYDSFVVNLARYCEILGHETHLVRNDATALDALDLRPYRAIIISPGPCAPEQAGISNGLIARTSGHIPILGVCLGHQCIGAVFGGSIKRAKHPMHGRSSLIHHDGTGLFRNLSQPLTVGRYHSLIVELEEGPLRAQAWSEEGDIMAFQHESHPTFGVQFHPESILTPQGLEMMKNFLEMTHD